MRIIARKTLVEYGKKYPEAKGQLDAWYIFVNNVKWNKFADVTKFSNTADLIQKHTVIFDIKGNQYRLEVKIYFTMQTIYVIWFGTHKEYDERNKGRK